MIAPKVGLSLSFCILDIVRGKMDINNVHFISTGTCARDNDDWQWLMDSYSEFYWDENPEEAVKIATQLRDTGKLIQPRLEGLNLPRIQGRSNHWTDIHEYNNLMREANVPQD